MPIVSGSGGAARDVAVPFVATSLPPGTVFTVDEFGELLLQGTDGNPAFLRLSDTGNVNRQVILESDSGLTINVESGGVFVGDATNAVVGRIEVGLGLSTAQNTAPSTSFLGNGEAAIWLDATPGATKLMVKAKDSGGTVRTAAVALA